MGNEPYAAIAIIQQQVLDKLDGFIDTHNQQPGNLAVGETNLWQQLLGKDPLPRNVDLSFLHEIGALALPQLFRDGGDPLDMLRDLFRRESDNISKLLLAKSPK